MGYWVKGLFSTPVIILDYKLRGRFSPLVWGIIREKHRVTREKPFGQRENKIIFSLTHETSFNFFSNKINSFLSPFISPSLQ